METDASNAEAETGPSDTHGDTSCSSKASLIKAETTDEAAKAVAVPADAQPQRGEAAQRTQQTNASPSAAQPLDSPHARPYQGMDLATSGVDPPVPHAQANGPAIAPSPDPEPIPTPSPNRGRRSTRPAQRPYTSSQNRDGPSGTLEPSGTHASPYPTPSPADLTAAASAAALAAALGSARLAAIAAAREKPPTAPRPRTMQPPVRGGTRGGLGDAPPSPTASAAASPIVGGRGRGGRGSRGDALQPPSAPLVVRGGRGGRLEAPASPTGSVAASVTVGGRRGGRGGRRGGQLSPTSSVISMPMTPTHMRGGRPPRRVVPARAGAPADRRRSAGGAAGGAAGGDGRRITAFADPSVAAAAVAAAGGGGGGGGAPAGSAAAAAAPTARTSTEQELLVSHSKVLVDRELLAVEVRRLASQVQHLTEQQGLLQGELQRLLNQNSSLNSALASTVTTCESQAELMDILSEAVRSTVLVDEHDVVAAKAAAGTGTVTVRLEAAGTHGSRADGNPSVETEEEGPLTTIAE